ncbi:hypothetical protein [Streptomyces subrutilus]|uniref:Uncharacterized protein n=1 Tax=Streptomyces subrutilus TaxID=36818 RepID=A0A1E5Q023_9ACTN|nr:hypothetical protein [Streptomyces subrutilus]OEJ35093.1 hypothetical protein BGK67_30625 [Streptomyces subrutilus]
MSTATTVVSCGGCCGGRSVYRSACCLVFSILGDGDGAFGSPRRIIWRDYSGRAHLVLRGMRADDSQVLVPGWDPRLVSALVAVHQAFEPAEEAGAVGWDGS